MEDVSPVETELKVPCEPFAIPVASPGVGYCTGFLASRDIREERGLREEWGGGLGPVGCEDPFGGDGLCGSHEGYW